METRAQGVVDIRLSGLSFILHVTGVREGIRGQEGHCQIPGVKSPPGCCVEPERQEAHLTAEIAIV